MRDDCSAGTAASEVARAGLTHPTSRHWRSNVRTRMENGGAEGEERWEDGSRTGRQRVWRQRRAEQLARLRRGKTQHSGHPTHKTQTTTHTKSSARGTSRESTGGRRCGCCGSHRASFSPPRGVFKKIDELRVIDNEQVQRRKALLMRGLLAFRKHASERFLRRRQHACASCFSV
jgi:hypothetical protein